MICHALRWNHMSFLSYNLSECLCRMIPCKILCAGVILSWDCLLKNSSNLEACLILISMWDCIILYGICFRCEAICGERFHPLLLSNSNSILSKQVMNNSNLDMYVLNNSIYWASALYNSIHSIHFKDDYNDLQWVTKF